MRRTRVRLTLFTAALVCALSVTGIAVASNSTPPKLVSPRPGGALHIGKVNLVIYDPGLSGDARDLFITINDARKLDRYGHLKWDPNRCKDRCDFVGPKPWKGHPGKWIFHAPYNFPGYWGVTPGTYYWQVHHYVPNCSPTCVEYSPIHKFRIVP